MEYQDPNHRHQQNNRSQEPNHRHNNVNRARAAQQNRRPTPEKDDTTEFATISREGFANMKPMGFKETIQAKSDYLDQKAKESKDAFSNYSIENVTGIKKSMTFADDLKAKSDYYKENTEKLGSSNSVAQLNTKGDSISVKPELHIGNALNHDDQDRLSKEQQGKNANPEMLYPNKQDNTRVDSFNQKANFIQGQEQKRLDKQAEQAYYQTPEGMAYYVYSGASKDNPNNATVKASNQHHPAVGTDLQKLTHDPVIKGVAAGLPLGYAAEAAAASSLINTSKPIFVKSSKDIVKNIGRDLLNQFIVNEGDVTKIDVANMLASGFIKNKVLKNFISATFDIKNGNPEINEFEEIVNEFILREMTDKVFTPLKPKPLETGLAKAATDLTKKGFRKLVKEIYFGDINKDAESASDSKAGK